MAQNYRDTVLFGSGAQIPGMPSNKPGSVVKIEKFFTSDNVGLADSDPTDPSHVADNAVVELQPFTVSIRQFDDDTIELAHRSYVRPHKMAAADPRSILHLLFFRTTPHGSLQIAPQSGVELFRFSNTKVNYWENQVRDITTTGLNMNELAAVMLRFEWRAVWTQ